MRTVSLIWLLACAGSSLVPTGDTASSTTTTPPSSSSTPSLGALHLTVEGRTYELPFEQAVGLSDAPVASLEFRAEHPNRTPTVQAFILDEQPLREATYALGQWGSNLQRTEIGLLVVDQGETMHYLTGDAEASEGSLTIERLDRVAGRVSLSWSGVFDKTDANDDPIGTGEISGSFVDVPLEVAGTAR